MPPSAGTMQSLPGAWEPPAGTPPRRAGSGEPPLRQRGCHPGSGTCLKSGSAWGRESDPGACPSKPVAGSGSTGLLRGVLRWIPSAEAKPVARSLCSSEREGSRQARADLPPAEHRSGHRQAQQDHNHRGDDGGAEGTGWWCPGPT